MKADKSYIADHWALTAEDQVLVMSKSKFNRLSFALLLLFYRAQGRFPNTPEEIERSVVDQVAQQLDISVVSPDSFDRLKKRLEWYLQCCFSYAVTQVDQASPACRPSWPN
ncbi:MAG: DUF4158 domain-containing protein [Deltaproteobacteria bacterium]|nr:DUF4158 domain-containing protein [Deltaproteobacteria bacterium]